VFRQQPVRGRKKQPSATRTRSRLRPGKPREAFPFIFHPLLIWFVAKIGW
jgi:hypothetical protein